MDKSMFYNITDKDIRTVEIRFNNGESILIPYTQLKKLDIKLTGITDAIGNSMFKHAFLFSIGSIEIDKSFLRQMLGDNIYDRLQYRNGINFLLIEFPNEEYKIKSDIPMMMCLVETVADATGTTKLKYEDDDSTFTISWIPVGVL